MPYSRLNALAAQTSLRRGGRPADELALIGDEDTVAAGIERYLDAGATEVSIAYSHFGGTADQRRTFALAGELNRARASGAAV